MVIDNKYKFGDIVYVKTDPDQHKRIVCSINVYPGGFMYKVVFGIVCSDHYELELSNSPDQAMKLGYSND